MRRLPVLLAVCAFAWAGPGAVPVDEALEALSRDWGLTVEWGGGPLPHVAADPSRPPLVRLAELGKATRSGFRLWQTMDGGPVMKLSQTEHPVLAYAVEGPLALVWHGLATTKDHNFEEPAKPIRATRYRLSLVEDPRSHARAGDGGRAIRDLPVTFRVGGKEMALQSDHRPGVFGSGPQWEFAPRPELAGTAEIEVTMPYVVPAGTGRAKLPWAAEGTARSEGAVLTLKKVEAGKDTMQDPADPFRQVEVQKFTATFHLVHPEAVGMMSPDQKTRPTPEQMQAFAKFAEGGKGVLAAHEARLQGAGGAVLRGVLKSADGMHGPPMGYTFKAVFKTPDAAFKPSEFEIVWAEGFQKREARLRIVGASLDP